ncbi:MAG: hypothetical protein ABIH21_00345 [Patescibacteria group bacterium]
MVLLIIIIIDKNERFHVFVDEQQRKNHARRKRFIRSVTGRFDGIFQRLVYTILLNAIEETQFRWLRALHSADESDSSFDMVRKVALISYYMGRMHGLHEGEEEWGTPLDIDNDDQDES